MTRPKFLIAVAVLLAGAAAPAARAQSATDILERATNGAHGRAAGVNDYTVRMSLLSGTFTTFHSRSSQSEPFRVSYAAQGGFAQSSTILAWADALLLMFQDSRAMRARRSWLSYGGVDSVAGAPVYVVTATFPPTTPWAGASRPRTFTVKYDTVTLFPLRLEIVTERRNLPDARTSVEFADYRPIQAVMQIPFTRRVVMTGLRDAYSPEAIAQMRQLVAGLRSELPQKPEPERALAARLADTLERVLEHDELVQDVTVTSAVANQGPPAGIPLQSLAMP
jgi:hypothetical protein